MRTRHSPAGLAALAALAVTFAGCPDWRRNSPGCELGATGPRAYDALAYDLAARFDWETRTLHATEGIRLAVCPGGSPEIELDAPRAVSRVRVLGRDVPFQLDPAAEVLRVELPAESPGGDPVTLGVEYTVQVADITTGSATARGLVATDSEAGDPVRTRVVFTDSEPRDGHTWLVQKDDPADRALFSITLDLPEGEDAVANGERVLDEPLEGGGRRVGYALDVPIPTYLMAFAAGELEHVERTHPSATRAPFPVALWHRRGLAVDAAAHLDLLEAQLDAFEQLLGPYPWGRYAVLLVPPPFRGGMENATVTFNAESSGTGWINDELNAHELAHQWLGDWVTMRTYDDVWVKEGMATLLGSEAQRATRDRGGRGRLFGLDFVYDPDDAIVDFALHGGAKYTSGPYFRAAALLTQIRARVGEEAFWGSVRAFLAEHAAGSATGEEFLRAFQPHLGEADVRRALDLLPRKGAPLPWLAQADGDGEVQFKILFPQSSLLVMPTIAAVDTHGAAHDDTFRADWRLARVPAGGYLALDESDVHPYFLFPPDTGPCDPGPCPYVPTLVPPALGPAADAYLARSAAHQERAALVDLPALEPAELRGWLAALDSDYARRWTLRLACERYAGASTAWQAALAAEAADPPVVRYDAELWGCGEAVGAPLEAELLALEAAPEAADLARLEYLVSFRYGPDGLAAIQRLAQGAPSLELRGLAARRLQLEPAPLRAGVEAPPGGVPETRSEAHGPRVRGLP